MLPETLMLADSDSSMFYLWLIIVCIIVKVAMDLLKANPKRQYKTFDWKKWERERSASKSAIIRLPATLPQGPAPVGAQTLANADRGYVYILKNSAMPGLLKIGHSRRSAALRSNELSGGTGVPMPFEVAWEESVSRCEEVEKEVHLRLAAHRFRRNREFFIVELKDAISVVKETAQKLNGK